MNTYNKKYRNGTFEGFGFELELTGEILYMPEGIWFSENGPAPRPDKKWKERVKAFIEETA